MRTRRNRLEQEDQLFVSNLQGWNPPNHPPGGGGKKKPPTPPAPGAGPIIPPTKGNAPYTKALSAIMPYLSPEDRTSQAALYGIKNPNPRAPVPSQITGGVRNQYLSQQRASQALAALAKSGATGPGANFLNNAIKLLQTYGSNGPNEGMSRENYTRMTTALGELLRGIKGQSGMSPYAALAQSFIAPTFSTGALMEQDKKGNFGVPSNRLFT